jgi:hypothetical protein
VELMVNWSVVEATALMLSITWTVKLKAPAAVGTPLNTPAELSVNPGGKAPLEVIQLV